MDSEGFWKQQQQRRLSRRRLLRGVFGVGLSATAASLLGCSALVKKPEDAATPGAALSRPEDTTGVAKAGGTLKSYVIADAQNFDPLASATIPTFTQIAAYTYPRLMRFTPAVYPDHSRGNVEGDLVESYEVTPDRLQYTLRLRQGLKWENKAPTNARLIDGGDALFSWNKFSRFSAFRTELAYNVDAAPGAPVDTVTSPDPRTLVFKLKQTDASFLSLLASDRLLYVMPRESDGGFDPRTEVRGYGPWLMTENRPGVLRVWSKNPDYHVKGRPFMDKIEHLVVSEYASRLAQFRAGLIWPSVASQDDIIETNKAVAGLSLRQLDNYSTVPSTLGFGYDGDSPWKDERLRQAVSLLIDRETMVDLKTDRGRFAAEGLPVDLRYHTSTAAGWEDFWVDPMDAGKFGSDGKLFAYDPTEARRLMEAAGFSDGIETLLHYNGGNEYSPSYTRTAELLSGMLHAGDIRARLDPRDYASDWLPNYQSGYTPVANLGKPIRGFPGLIYRPGGGSPTMATQVYSAYHRNGSRFVGMTADGKNAQNGDADINRAVENLRREFEVDKQKSMALELARLMARKAYDIPAPAHSSMGFSLSWPVIANLGTYRGWPAGSPVTETSLHQWLDSTKPPLTPVP